MTYTTHRDTQATLHILDEADMDVAECTDNDLYKRFGLEEQYEVNQLTTWQRIKPKIWAVFEMPRSSVAAKVDVPNSLHDLITLAIVKLAFLIPQP
ncbi:unnamed protein product [Hydatigera taeniaeformis]|uniref:DUF4158 domain-containing protein n=1 Tax=Hydatigena taeniaeformis TaxID=6205 RepID=A0A0R3WLX1_HYDTA|nr:unnamed protein product [Hydatigera taeniaeformis]